jgi:hypothetical protein
VPTSTEVGPYTAPLPRLMGFCRAKSLSQGSRLSTAIAIISAGVVVCLCPAMSTPSPSATTSARSSMPCVLDLAHGARSTKGAAGLCASTANCQRGKLPQASALRRSGAARAGLGPAHRCPLAVIIILKSQTLLRLSIFTAVSLRHARRRPCARMLCGRRHLTRR